MRVLYLTNNPFNVSRVSTTIATEGWFRSLRPRGLEPVVVSNKFGTFHHWAIREGVPAYEIALPLPSKSKPWNFLGSLWRLRQVVKRHAIELIHCNEQEIYPIGQYLGRICGLPVVVTVHFRMERAFCEWAFRGARRPMHMFFVSRRNLEECRPGVEGLVPENLCSVLHNGLDMQDYQPNADLRDSFRREHNLDSQLLIGVACALRPRKQVEHLIEAASRIKTTKFTLALAGGPMPGDEAYAETLVAKGKETLSDRFLYLGHLDELRGFLNALDLFVNTSREESFGMAVLEALACGAPVVGYPSKAVDEVVLPYGGEMVEQDNIDELTATLDSWLSYPRRIAEARDQARKQAEQFDIGKIAHRLWDQYLEVCGAHAAQIP